MTEPRPDWDDERLRGAFLARAAGSPPTPRDLLPVVMDRIPDRASRRGGRAPWLAAAAGLAIVLAVGTVVGLGPSPHVPGSSPDRPRGSEPGAPAPTTALGAALGDPITIPAAIAIRDGATAPGRELVVAGFLSPLPILACPFIPADANPTRITCPQSFQWLMDQPEILMTVGASGSLGGPPKGPAIHPSFALVDPPTVPIPESGAVRPVPVVLIGHFHDRRAARCAADPAPETPCGDAFLVDRVAVVNGAQRLPMTIRRLEHVDPATQRQVTETPIDLEEDVDRLVATVAPDAQIEGRLLVTMDQVFAIEPALKDDQVIGAWGNPADLLWIVSAVDLRDGLPVARTFALIDGTNWFAEITADGAVMHERRVTAGPSDGAEPIAASADPTAFDEAPTSVLGIQVRDIATVMRDRRADVSDLGRDELAIRAWYVGPRPDAPCTPAEPAIHPPTPPCDAARRWLLDRPDQLGIEPGQLRSSPDHWPPVLNPLLPIDVPFATEATWAGSTPIPQPVVVLGHFSDMRVETYAGNLYFVIDALAWTRGGAAGSIDSVTRLTTGATASPTDVLDRINAVSPEDPVATWTTVVDAADFASLEPGTAADAPEFTSGEPVWIVRRLIHDEMDGRQRLAVVAAYVADHGSRVWRSEAPDASPDLATSIDLRDPDARTRIIRVFDYGLGVVSVRETTGLTLRWQRIEQRDAGIEVARGASDREVAIRWTAGACNREWQVRLSPLASHLGSISVELRTLGDVCPANPVQRSLVIEFDHPVALESLWTEFSPSGG